jgi:hypothetical protein
MPARERSSSALVADPKCRGKECWRKAAITDRGWAARIERAKEAVRCALQTKARDAGGIYVRLFCWNGQLLRTDDPLGNRRRCRSCRLTRAFRRYRRAVSHRVVWHLAVQSGNGCSMQGATALNAAGNNNVCALLAAVDEYDRYNEFDVRHADTLPFRCACHPLPPCQRVPSSQKARTSQAL